eukprot:TRINITY_DN4232_c0_g1_i17.p1 TRINITY_DN4232_c0_g1~~TRINITY_DN4232_c0_g1_i17.p1  ORF type:complete len:517 (+),score=67.54 TRINITY_DN4232_c0_g1_i17:424-1974(+)
MESTIGQVLGEDEHMGHNSQSLAGTLSLKKRQKLVTGALGLTQNIPTSTLSQPKNVIPGTSVLPISPSIKTSSNGVQLISTLNTPVCTTTSYITSVATVSTRPTSSSITAPPSTKPTHTTTALLGISEQTTPSTVLTTSVTIETTTTTSGTVSTSTTLCSPKETLNTSRWILPRGKYVFDHNRKKVTRVKFANEHSHSLAWTSSDRTLTVADISNVNSPTYFILKGHKGEITDMDWSMTDDFILTSSLDMTLRVWDVVYKKVFHVYEQSDSIHSCAFHPVNNNYVAIGTQSHLEIYNFSTGKVMMRFQLSKQVNSITFSPNGQYLFAGCGSGNIFWYECKNKEFNCYKARGHFLVAKDRPIGSVAYHERYPIPVRNTTITTTTTVLPSSQFTVIPTLLVNVCDSTARLYFFRPGLRKSQQVPKECFILLTMCPVLNITQTIKGNFCKFPRKDGRLAAFVSGDEEGNIYCYTFPFDSQTYVPYVFFSSPQVTNYFSVFRNRIVLQDMRVVLLMYVGM